MKSERTSAGSAEKCEPLTGFTPWEAAQRCAHLPDLAFFDSALVRPGAVSLLAASPGQILQGETDGDWEQLRREVARRQGSEGFAAGYVEYEGGFRFGFYEEALRFHHDEARWTGKMLAGPSAFPRVSPEGICFAAETGRAEFEETVRRVQRYIAEGDIYQANLSHRFTGGWSGARAQALGLYGRLRECSPAPHAALLCTPERAILSSSPEEFLRMEGRRIVTRPIKGTRARGGEPRADEAAERELAGSAKERAELIMITDLERNDLGQVCEYGSVQVRDLLRLERFAQVFHLVSTVEGTLRPEIDHVSALRACFPGGSITGAPKKRAREIIAELERGPRGLYTGAIGYFGFDGASQFNIAIRTAILEQAMDGGTPQAHFHVGAGIVADSDAAAEWEETLHKAAGLLRAAGGATGQACDPRQLPA